MIKLAIFSLVFLMATADGPVKAVKLERLDSTKVRPGAELTIKGTVTFNHEACDEAPEKTSFYSKGAEITQSSDWHRIDKYSFYKELKVRVSDASEINASEVVVTLRLVKHTQKCTDQLKLNIVE